MSALDELGRAVTYKFNLPGGQSRLKEASLYVMQKCRDFEYFGLIKLNKILWRADFQSFRLRRLPVTGRQYQKLPMGPAPYEMKPLLNEMISEGNIELRHTDVPNELRPVALVDPVLRNFSPYDLSYLDEAIDFFRDMTGMEASDLSHNLAWKSREVGDPIPYDASYFDDRPLPASTLQRLEAMARERGWRTH